MWIIWSQTDDYLLIKDKIILETKQMLEGSSSADVIKKNKQNQTFPLTEDKAESENVQILY